MTPGSPSEVLELTVALDYGQFYLVGRRVQHPSDADLTLQLLDTAIDGPGIASSESNEVVVVLSPHQNNFAMRLRVERWTVLPPDDLDDWQEAFLTGLLVGQEGLAYESPPWRVRRSRCRRAGTRHGLPDEDSSTGGGRDRSRPGMRGGCSCGRRPDRCRHAGCAPGRVRHQRSPDPPGPEAVAGPGPR